MKKRTLFNLLITLILITFLIYKIKLDKIAAVFAQVNVPTLLLVFPFIFIIYVIRAIKWDILLKTIGVKTNLKRDLKIITIGVFYGMLSPGKAGELARSFYLKERKSITFPTVIWDKIIDISTLIILTAVAALFFLNDALLLLITLIITLTLVIGILFILNKKIINFLAKLFRISDISKKNYLNNMLKIAKDKKAILKVFLLSLLHYAFNFIGAAIVLISLKTDINLMITFTLPIIILLGNAPITISGLGLREFVSVLIFKVFNEPLSVGFSFGLLWFIVITLLPGIIGYFLCLTFKKRK